VSARRTLVLLLAALAAATPAAPADAKAKTRSFTGRLEIRHRDDFKHGRSTTRYRLLHKGRRPAPLVLTRAPRIASGTSVVVKGKRVGSRLRGTLRPLRAGLHAAGITPGARKTAVILVQFSGGPAPSWTPDEVRQRVFTAADSTNAYYQEDSYGDVSLVGKLRADGDVFGWYTVPGAGPACDVNAVAYDAEEAAAADGFVSSGYAHVIYAFPYDSACGWAGLGELPGSHSWINGYIDRVSVVAHELGHNMGLHHASSLRCTDAGVPVTIGGTCTTSEYGDPFDVMGTASRRNNGWHLRQIGFMPASGMQTVDGDGTYTLNSTSTRGGTQLLRVRRAAPASPPYYDLELRAPGGVFDNFGPADFPVQGVTIHTNPEPAFITQSQLLDANPATSSFGDAPLPVGNTFTDGTVSITVQSISGGVATVQVAGGAPGPDTTPPSAPVPVVATAAADRVTLSWPVSTDNVGVAGYRVYRSNSLVKTLATATSWTDLVVSPGATYSYRVAAFDAAGNTASSAPVSATIPSPPSDPGDPDPPIDDPVTPVGPGTPPPLEPDRGSPWVNIGAPRPRARVRRPTVVRATAADAVGVVRMKVWIDGRLRRSVGRSKLAWRWPLRHAKPGRHRVTVRAYDAAGNVGKASIRVRVTR
jgi:gametolysin peptidase M11/Big-like domain-containing protein